MDAFELTTAVESANLQFWRMKVVEELGRPFTIHIDRFTAEKTVTPADFLGTSMTVKINKPEKGERYFNGLVSRFAYTGTRGRYHIYSAVLRPWLWFLTRTSDCRIFQQKTVPD